MELLVISVGRCKMNSCFHAVGLALILVLGAFYGATNTGAEPRPDRCSGILHRDRYGLRLGCGRGEGEDICVIRKKDERKVLAVCALGRYHFVNPGCANKLNYRTASKCIQSLRPW